MQALCKLQYHEKKYKLFPWELNRFLLVYFTQNEYKEENKSEKDKFLVWNASRWFKLLWQVESGKQDEYAKQPGGWNEGKSASHHIL